MVITEIIEREPSRTTPSAVLDDAILAFLADGQPRELREITKAVDGDTHGVHARAQSLVKRGLVAWTRRTGGPTRGPGASTYQLAGL